MPNKYQLVFLATIVTVFSGLVFLSHLLNRLLLAAGYDYRNIILIGLPKPEPIPQPPLMSLQQLVESVVPASLQAVDLPVFGTVNVVAVATSPAFLISSAIIIATAVWTKVAHTGQ